MRNTKAFKEAVAQTLAELARQGVTLAPATVEDTIEKQITTVSERLGIQTRSAWRYFDAKITADRLADNPRPQGAFGSGDVLRIHVGAYRVLYEISDRQVRVHVIHLGRLR